MLVKEAVCLIFGYRFCGFDAGGTLEGDHVTLIHVRTVQLTGFVGEVATYSHGTVHQDNVCMLFTNR